MPDTPWPNDSPVAYDRLIINRTQAPGFVRDISVRRGRKMDEQDAKGANGATLIDHGRKLALVRIVLEVQTRKSWQSLCEFVRALTLYKSTPDAYEMIHPILAMHGLSKFVVENFNGPERIEPSIWHFTLDCKEYAPMPKGTGNGSVTVGVMPPFDNVGFPSKKPTPKVPWTGSGVSGADPFGTRAAQDFANSPAGRAATNAARFLQKPPSSAGPPDP